jgi:hypothetical protein
MTKSYYAGMEVDAPCGRCKGETRHRILSITEGIPEKLICVNCNAVHKFRAEKPSRPEPVSRVPRVGPSAPKATTSPSRFQELMIQEQAGAKARPYNVVDHWEEGSWMDHPSFGLGKVQRRNGRKVDVLFREGLKTLISG